MNEIDVDDDIKRAMDVVRESSWNSPLEEPAFIKPKLDFELCPDDFINWLDRESMTNSALEEITGDYAFDCASMCEYACLYISMLLHEEKIAGDLRIVYGKFGFWGHYWMEYTLDGQSYYIDLTLQQFIPTAPRLAISLKSGDIGSYRRPVDPDGTDYKEYVDRKDAFVFYEHP